MAHTQRSRSPSIHLHHLHEWLNCLQPHASTLPRSNLGGLLTLSPINISSQCDVSTDIIPTFTSNIKISRWEDAFPVWVMHPLTTRILHQQQSFSKHRNITQNYVQHQNSSRHVPVHWNPFSMPSTNTACSQSNLYLLILLTPSSFNYCPTLSLTCNPYPQIFISERCFICATTSVNVQVAPFIWPDATHGIYL